MADKVVVVTDTTACIPREQVERYDIEMVPVDIIFGDKVYRDVVDISAHEFYALLRKSKKPPTTSGSSPVPFLEAYRRASQRASHVLCITLPSSLSVMSRSARMAVEMAKEELPGVAIELLDCATAAAAQGLVVLAAARAAAAGKGPAQVAETARSVMSRVHLFAMLDTLYYLVKGGRVPAAAALASSLLKIKPIFTINHGDAHPVAHVRTISRAMKRIARLLEEKVIDGQPLHVAVMHADALDRAKEMMHQITCRFDCAELFITEFTPVMGVHTGPGVVGVAFYSGD
ncbi:MAG: DegV family protein [Chloroflexi bacterium]|nr:DegV family protein [Chloroflexota bacterium]